MALSIGIGSALAVGGFAQWFGLDRDRAFYPTVMMVIAFLYVLFAAIGGGAAIPIEAAIGVGFATLAALGFKKSPWFVVAALVGHGLFDLVHPHAIDNGGVPPWWPEFCSAYDVTAGAWLALRLYCARARPSPRPRPAASLTRHELRHQGSVAREGLRSVSSAKEAVQTAAAFSRAS